MSTRNRLLEHVHENRTGKGDGPSLTIDHTVEETVVLHAAITHDLTSFSLPTNRVMYLDNASAYYAMPVHRSSPVLTDASMRICEHWSPLSGYPRSASSSGSTRPNYYEEDGMGLAMNGDSMYRHRNQTINDGRFSGIEPNARDPTMYTVQYQMDNQSTSPSSVDRRRSSVVTNLSSTSTKSEGGRQKCDHCGKWYKNGGSLRRHKTWLKAPFAFKCPDSECNRSFKNARDCKRHRKHQHGCRIVYRCPYEGAKTNRRCPKKFKRMDYVKRHLQCSGPSGHSLLAEEAIVQMKHVRPYDDRLIDERS